MVLYTGYIDCFYRSHEIRYDFVIRNDKLEKLIRDYADATTSFCPLVIESLGKEKNTTVTVISGHLLKHSSFYYSYLSENINE